MKRSRSNFNFRLQAVQVVLQLCVRRDRRHAGVRRAGRAVQLRGLHRLLHHDHGLHLPDHRPLGLAPHRLAQGQGVPRLRRQRGSASVRGYGYKSWKSFFDRGLCIRHLSLLCLLYVTVRCAIRTSWKEKNNVICCIYQTHADVNRCPDRCEYINALPTGVKMIKFYCKISKESSSSTSTVHTSIVRIMDNVQVYNVQYM